MSSFGKPDVTGRSSGILTGRNRKLRSPPKGEPWVWMTRELLASSAMRARSLTGRRLLDFLLIEHMSHAGLENGNLVATKDQLTDFGLSRRLVPAAVRELVFLGLVRVKNGSARGAARAPSRYRLTFFASGDGAPPTNEWKGVTQEAIDVWRQGRRPSGKILKGDPKSGSGNRGHLRVVDG